ncbi:MAG: prepilin-type N-terminal cleavage/methylation domain-containing protein, partial [Psychrobacter sp.]|nr:prepilin-type N-terminal cleavage/methylation domain-containing protein [Psychrobacter sp.]
MKSSYGFTLLELMVAMAIFAMLAVAGWQVFDGVNRARERAQFHADNVAALQYAYLQLQQDMGQIIPYQAPNTQNTS